MDLGRHEFGKHSLILFISGKVIFRIQVGNRKPTIPPDLNLNPFDIKKHKGKLSFASEKPTEEEIVTAMNYFQFMFPEP